jgi:hypothetical protein
MEYRVSYFPNVSGKKTRDIDLNEVFDIIRTGPIKKHIEAIRDEQDDTKRDALKINTPAITLSGIFKERHALSDFMNHSGLIQVDFDKVSSPLEVKTRLCKDPFTFGCFISPSGTGVKAIVKIAPDRGLHENSFASLARYYYDTYGLEMDRKCRDLSRLCFLSYDPDLYVNEKARLFVSTHGPDSSKPKSSTGTVNQSFNLSDDVEKVITRIEASKTDITIGYDNWLKLGFALADGLGINGLPFFHRLSRF